VALFFITHHTVADSHHYYPRLSIFILYRNSGTWFWMICFLTTSRLLLPWPHMNNYCNHEFTHRSNGSLLRTLLLPLLILMKAYWCLEAIDLRMKIYKWKWHLRRWQLMIQIKLWHLKLPHYSVTCPLREILMASLTPQWPSMKLRMLPHQLQDLNLALLTIMPPLLRYYNCSLSRRYKE